MQRTANLFTALTALALAVAFVAGIAFQQHERSDAAAATIAALNVGTCHTTDLDVLDEADCNEHRNNFEFNRAGLSEAIEVETLYATYAHDPKTADEPPRGILVDSDLLKISIRDEGRDVREGVLVVSDDNAIDAWQSAGLDQEVIAMKPATGTPGTNDFVAAVPAVSLGEALSEAEVDIVGLRVEPDFVFEITSTASDTNPATLTSANSGIIDILVKADAGASPTFKPIAQAGDRGEMRFFGKFDPDGMSGAEPPGDFMELDAFLEWDEDVVPGSDQSQPAASLLVNIPQGGSIEIQAIHYLTSQVEVMVGGETCVPVGFIGIDENPLTEEKEFVPRKEDQVACTEEELGDENAMDTLAEQASDNEAIRLEVSGDGLQTSRDLVLVETGRFTGVFEGYVRLTDADGDGWALAADDEREPMGRPGAERNNWGLEVKRASDEPDPNPNDDMPLGRGTIHGAAVIGVDNGPVRISYRDTDGTVRNFNIAIDIGPPTIDVNAPQHEGRSDDEEINFTGTANDGESGLAEDSFALYLDHIADEDNTAQQALELPVDGSIGLGNVIADAGAEDMTIATETQYAGYSETSPKFGEITVDQIYPVFPWSVTVTTAVDEDDNEVEVKGITAEDFADGASDAEFRDSITVNFDIGDDDYDHAIDFQAVVRDTAGNIGFSDSDEAAPRYINDLGTNPMDDDRVIPNVLGIYSSHVVYIDNIDPRVHGDRTVTGFYDVDDDDDPIVDRSGIMIVFDGPVDERSIDNGTFLLTLGDADREEILDVVDTSVTDELVFLRLADDLPSDAEPTLSISAGGEVRDLAGRVTRSDEPLNVGDDGEREITVNDGILPVFTVELSEGSGTGEGNEGPSRLTRNTIKVAITSDEDIQGAPKVAVVCSNYVYGPEIVDGSTTTADDLENDIEDYINSLGGALTGAETPTGRPPSDSHAFCGVGSGATRFVPVAASALSRRGNEWEYTWRQYSGVLNALPDGPATVVIFGNDRSNYVKHDAANEQILNYGVANMEFRFDSDFESPLEEGSGGRVLPAPDSGVAERRPFVLLDFSGEPTTVVIEELLVDGEDVTSAIGQEGQNRFLYWPESLASGEHEVEFKARDAADNDVEGSFKFEITTRDPFVLSLFAGWNAISFPSDPRDTTLESVFADAAIDRVVGWAPGSDTGPWAVATKVDNVWTTSAELAALTDVTAQYGYWVHSTEFIDISVELQAPPDRESLEVPSLRHVPTYPGWNFVGVVDQDGDQTEGRAGDNLKDGIINLETEDNAGEQDDMLVEDYLTGFAQAYRWDVITNSYEVLKASDNLKIGEGIWAYFGEGIAP